MNFSQKFFVSESKNLLGEPFGVSIISRVEKFFA